MLPFRLNPRAGEVLATIFGERTTMTMAATVGGVRTGGMTAEERKVIFASSLGTVFEWYDFYIYGTLGVVPREILLLHRSRERRLHLHAARLCRGLRGPAVRRADLRPPRRHDRPQIHIPDHHVADGRRHVFHRPAAGLCELGHRGADRADRAPPGPGPCARRRIWWRGDLRRRARAAKQARLLHLVDPDHRDARPVPGLAADPRHPDLDG